MSEMSEMIILWMLLPLWGFKIKFSYGKAFISCQSLALFSHICLALRISDLSDQSKHLENRRGVKDSELRSSKRPQRMKDAEDAKKNDQLPQENRKSHACNVVVRLLMGMLKMRWGGVLLL